jgi:predicted Zn-dependent protease
MAACPFCYPTKESGEWGKQKVIELLAKIADNAEKNKGQLASSFLEGCETYIMSLLETTEKQAREEDIEEAFEKSAWGKAKAEMLLEEGRQRGADEMLERMIAMVPEEHYGLLGVQIGRVYNAEDKAWNACREAILTSLRSLKSKE